MFDIFQSKFLTFSSPKMASDIRKCLILALLTLLTVSVIPSMNLEYKENIPRYSMDPVQTQVLEFTKPGLEAFSGNWIFCLIFYFMLVSLVMALPRDHWYKFPGIQITFNTEKTSNHQNTIPAMQDVGLGSIYLATWLINRMRKHKAVKLWFTVISLALHTDLLTWNQNEQCK